MKKSVIRIILVIMQALFMFITPCILLWVEYGNSAFIAVKYKINLTGVLFLLVFFFLSKRFWLDEYIKGINEKIRQIETNSLGITDQTALKTMKKEYRKLRLIDLLIKMLIPVVVLVGSVFIIKAVETQVLKLYGVFMWSTVSFGVGIVFKVLEIFCLKFKNEMKEQDIKEIK